MFSPNYKQAPIFTLKQGQAQQQTSQPLNLNGQNHIMISQSSMHQQNPHFVYGNSVDSAASSVAASSLLSAANTLVLSPPASSSPSFSPLVPSSSLQSKRGSANFTNTLFKLQQEPSSLNHESLDFDLHYSSNAGGGDDSTAQFNSSSSSQAISNSKASLLENEITNNLNKVNVTTNSISSGSFGHVLFKEEGDDLDPFDEELMPESISINDENEYENNEEANELHEGLNHLKHINDNKTTAAKASFNGLLKNNTPQVGFLVNKSKSMSMNMPIESNQSVINGVCNAVGSVANNSIDLTKESSSSVSNSLSTSALGWIDGLIFYQTKKFSLSPILIFVLFLYLILLY
jgi:hypothetical protein